MFDKIWNLYKKNKEVINYLIFGGLTTVVNFVVYFIAHNILSIDEIISNIIAWFLAVLFAYVTNKIFVFESKKNSFNAILYEISSFFACRVFSGIVETGLFALMIKKLMINDYISKIVTQIIVIILNYIFSKLIIFKKKEESKND